VNVIALQHDIVWENKTANFARVRKLLLEAAPERDSLVVLPEMFATGFSMNADVIAEPHEGPTEQFLADRARELGVYLLAGAAMCGREGRARNKALVFSPTGELLAFYAKMRPFTPGGEREHYEAGRRPAAFRWGACTVSPFICYDLRFPEIFREAVAAHRPELFAVIANWPAKRIQHWGPLLQARAIENQCWVVAPAQAGRHNATRESFGHTAVFDPWGKLVGLVERPEPGFVIAKIDYRAQDRIRAGLPCLRHARRELHPGGWPADRRARP